MTEPWTIKRVIRFCVDDFAARGLDTPRLDAELIVGKSLGITRVQIYMDMEREVLPEELARVREFIVRRRKHEPMAYLLEEREFFGRPFVVNPDVLIPRPDTETLVEVALELLPGVRKRKRKSELSIEQRSAPTESTETGESQPTSELQPASEASSEAVPPLHILDVCCGTGCIGLTLAAERPANEVVLTDASVGALEVARKNSDALGLSSRVTLLEGDLFAPVAGRLFDLIVSNPPYIATAEISTLAADVRDFEPALALDGGDDGLRFYRRIAAESPRHLRSGGHLVLEVGYEQAHEVSALLSSSGGFSDVQTRRDLGGVERVVFAKRAE